MIQILTKNEIEVCVKELKIAEHAVSYGTSNNIPYAYIEISEGSKATIKKLEKMGFKYRHKSRFEQYGIFHKQYTMEVSQ